MLCSQAVVIISLFVLTVEGSLKHGSRSKGHSLTDAFPFYHTSAALVSEASVLAASGACKGLSVFYETEGDVSVPVAELPASNSSAQRVLMVFGEHARELISSETGLHFIQELCGSEGADLRKTNHFVMVLNANPSGRQSVESGEYCARTNANGVDLNRNYGFHWEAEHADDDETGVGTKKGQPVEAFSSGTGPFSEPETRIVQRLINKTQPDIFLDVHSGTKGLFMPYDWTTDPIPNKEDRQRMQTVLDTVNTNDCPECMVGDCAETVGYLAPGSSADYAYSQGIKFSYIWEIYADAEDASQDLKDQQTFLARKRSGLSFWQARSSVKQPASSNVMDAGMPEWAKQEAAVWAPMEEETKQRCLKQFNPTTKEEYEDTVARWTHAFHTLCNSVQSLRSA